MLAIGFLLLATAAPSVIDKAFDRLYNFDFAGAHLILDDQIKNDPHDGLAYAVRASALLFQELHRLQILESEFFAEDKRIADKKKLRPDEHIRTAFDSALQAAEREAQVSLSAKLEDADSLFTLSLVSGLRADYMAFVEKRQLQSLSSIRQSQTFAVRLLKSHPNYSDAELTSGACEYLLGSLPFFVRWFVRFDGVEGQKSVATQKLERVALKGRYLGPFARILLAIMHVREKQPTQALAVLNKLSRDFPQNPLFRSEAKKLTEMMDGAKR